MQCIPLCNSHLTPPWNTQAAQEARFLRDGTMSDDDDAGGSGTAAGSVATSGGLSIFGQHEPWFLS